MACTVSRARFFSLLRSHGACYRGSSLSRSWHEKSSFEGLSASVVWDEKSGIALNDQGEIKIISQNNTTSRDPLAPWLSNNKEVLTRYLEFQAIFPYGCTSVEDEDLTSSFKDVFYYDDVIMERQCQGQGHIEVKKLPVTTKQYSNSGMASFRRSLSTTTTQKQKRSFHTSTRHHVKVPTIECDYVIVGAGSAGCTLANRLSDDGNSVMLLEAGPKDRMWNWKVHMPSALMYNLWDDKYNWYYHTEKQAELNGRQILCPRGRIWGGSSALNGMVYVRGHANDFDRWEKEGAEGWSYADCLPYFRRAQTHQLGANEYRGGDGPLHVSRAKSSNPLFETFTEAGVQAGYPFTDDVNGYQQEGFGPIDRTIHKGQRWSAYKAYLEHTKNYRQNLRVESKTFTNRILLDGNRAVGVEYTRGNRLEHVYTRKEVIVASGAINSPQLLLLSGIGNADELAKLGICVQHHLPGVGENLQDHLEIYVQHECKEPITLYTAQKWYNMIPIGLQWFMSGTGLGATNHMETGGFIRSSDDPALTHPDLQFHFLPSIVIDHARIPPDKHAFQAHVGTLRPTSRGHVKLRSTNPREAPIIDPKYLTTEKDKTDFRESLKLTREIFAQKAFDRYRGKEILPGPDVQSDDQIDAFVRKYTDTAYHVSCTCKMGSEDDPMAVVDSSARVIGMENLRVVDSSIMPSMSSGNLNAPTIMIAEKVADMILGKPPLPKSLAPVYKPTKGLQR